MDYKKAVYRLNLILLVLLIVINFCVALTPEIGFDALWYHLTFPKLWLTNHQWYFPGGLMYYSVMPRLTEVIYAPLIHFTGFIGPKLFQFISGIGTVYLIYKICKHLNLQKIYSLIAINLFYLTWLVSWQSGSAYIDLFRTFLETAALYLLLNNRKIFGGLVLGLAIGTKWLALGSLLIYGFIFSPIVIPVALLVASPWFLISFLYTHNPVFPLFTQFVSNTTPNIFSAILNTLLLPLKITFPFDDFISPVAGILISLCAIQIIFTRNNQIRKISLLAILGAIFSVSLNPPSSRFFLPFLPATAIASVYFISTLENKIQKYFFYLFLGSSIVIIILRLIAITKYIPFLTGHQSTNQFLASQSTKLGGTFIDSDNFVISNLPANKKYLIDKLHNLYYFPYGFDHTSWANDRSQYDYLITTNESESSAGGKLIHTNNLGIQIFKLK